jgi:Na+/H+ antiporter NhaD/arsenite permease-like protein
MMPVSEILARVPALLLVLPMLALSGSPAFAATGLDGAALSIVWALPFLGLLFSIALGPLLFPHVWEHHYGKFAAGWAALTLLPLAIVFGPVTAFEQALHAVLLEYMSFIILLFALFTVAGGVLIAGNLHGSAATNTAILAIGTVLASFVGTTGASMILIRPIIRANDGRRHNVHVVVFFIFLVSNVGGSLTPLGDPPLFVGFLRGVDFFWTTTHLFFEFALVAGLLLAVFFVVDSLLWRREGEILPRDPTPDSRLRLHGGVNLPLLGAIIAAILASAAWKPGIMIPFPGGELPLQALVRDAALVVIALASLALTARGLRERNGFNWHPILEVAKLFAGIFLCMIPVLAMLKAGTAGVFAPLIALITTPDGAPIPFAYYWLTGILSAFLDNAPTYLVFFELAGGDPVRLMGADALTLAAISAAAVFMGAMTYIGNAPNFMVYAIARNMGVKMPSFFGYMLWSAAVLLPILTLTGFVFFWR